MICVLISTEYIPFQFHVFAMTMLKKYVEIKQDTAQTLHCLITRFHGWLEHWPRWVCPVETESLSTCPWYLRP